MAKSRKRRMGEGNVNWQSESCTGPLIDLAVTDNTSKNRLQGTRHESEGEGGSSVSNTSVSSEHGLQ